MYLLLASIRNYNTDPVAENSVQSRNRKDTRKIRHFRWKVKVTTNKQTHKKGINQTDKKRKERPCVQSSVS